MTSRRLTEFTNAIGGSQAVTWATYLVMAPLAQSANLNRINGVGVLAPAQSVGYLVFGLLLFFVVVAFFRWLLRLRDPATVSPVWVVFGVYALMGVARALSPLIAGSLGIIPEQAFQWGYLVQTIVSSIVLFSMIAIAMDALQRQRMQLDELHGTAQRLAALRNRAAEFLHERTAAIKAAIDSQVTPTLLALRREVEQVAVAGNDPVALREVAETVRRGSSDSVQRLGRELAIEPEHGLPLEVAPVNALSRVPFTQVIRSLVSHNPFAPGPNAFVLLLLFVSISIYSTGSFVGLFAALVICAIAYLVLRGAQALFESLQRFRFVAWLVIQLLLGCCVATALIVAVFPGSTDRNAFVVASAVQLWCGLIIACVKATAVQLDLTGRALQASNESYQWETKGLQQAVSVLRRRAGSILHGDFQGRLVANALRLDLAADMDQIDERRTAVTQVADDLERMRFEVETITENPATEASLDANLDAIARKWRGIVSVEINPFTESAELLSVEQCAAISEVVREGINNAAKHGFARNVAVSLEFLPGRVDIRITDDGRGFTGSRPSDRPLLSSLQLQADRGLIRTANGRTQLRVVLPLNQTEPA